YVCKDQTGTTGKCDATVESCGTDEVYCLREKKWKSTSSSVGPPRQLSEHMHCATEEECSGSVSDMETCPTPPWKDWNCTACCKSDCCNGIMARSHGTVFQNLKLMLILVAGMLTALQPYLLGSLRIT
ncbi:hypothetical protein OTU49_016234, partial [Cherax quadricarinatus]